MKLLSPLALAAAVTLSLSLSGCASSMPRPDEQIASATTSVELAEQSGAREFGPAALESARTNLSLAQEAADRNDNETALRLATEAELDAELAAAQAGHYKAEEALAEIRDSIRTLRDEIARNELTGDQS